MSTASTLRLLAIATSMSQHQPKAYASTPPHPLPMCTDDRDACNEGDWEIDNGYCDDGGVRAESSLCRLGTDCTDCGPRCPAGYQLSNDQSSCTPCDVAHATAYSRHCQVSHCEGALFPNAARTACVDTADDTLSCNNDCVYRDDGYCDDYGTAPEGGESCRAGSDCGDCGLRNIIDCSGTPATEPDDAGTSCVACRRPGAATFVNAPGCAIETCQISDYSYALTDGRCVPAETTGCTYECPGHNGNGICEDGHNDAEEDLIFCTLGTDCGDCDQRALIPCSNMQEPVYNQQGTQECIDCSSQYFPNAKTFDAAAQGCVITECDDGYHLIELRGHLKFCSPYAEGHGCRFDWLLAFDGDCDDGGNGSHGTEAPLGGDCGDCPPRCLHHTEFNATTGRCEPCSRAGVLHYTHEVGCVIYSCMDGYELQGTGATAVCEAIPSPEPTAEPTAAPTAQDGASTSGSTSGGSTGNASDDDDGFNPLWLLLLLLLIPSIIGIAVFMYMRSRKPSSSQTEEKRFLQDDNIALDENIALVADEEAAGNGNTDDEVVVTPPTQEAVAEDQVEDNTMDL